MEVSETLLDNIPQLAFPDEARDVLRQLQQREGGLGVGETLHRLIEIFGPSSDSVASKLVDDLVPDPDGSTRASWEVALAQASEALGMLKRKEHGKCNFVYTAFLILQRTWRQGWRDQGEVGEMQGEDDAEHDQVLNLYAEYVGHLLM
ncbi:hypothetical protein APHAL10511_008128 [Amanita phalloides]|nr:hypothetical protein APHAL10511_008128 [Amanita phalloides]